MRAGGLRALAPVAAGLCLAPGAAPAQAARDTAAEQDLQARFFAKVCTFVDWPREAGVGDPGRPFVIGILGGPPLSLDNPWEDPLVRAMRALFPKQLLKGQKVSFSAIKTFEELKGCQAVYLMPSARRHVAATVKLVAPAHVLVFANTEGFAELGAHLNFKMVDQWVRFEINEASFQHSELRIDALLLRTATVVKRREARP